MMRGFGCYFIGLTLQRLFGGFLGHFFISGSYTDFIYYGDFDNTGLLFEVFFKIDYILWAFGAALFILAFEVSIKRTKYVLTIIQIPLILLLIILPYSSARFVHHYVLYPLNTTIIIAVIVLLSKESRFELKAISSLLFFGVLFLMISSGLVSKDVKALNFQYLLYLSPIFYIIGALVVILPLIINPIHLSHALKFWLLSGISVVIVIFSIESLLIYEISIIGLSVEEVFQIVLYLFMLLVVIFLEYQVIKDIKSNKLQDKKEDMPNILEMFTKPQRVTEEEVSVSKEKKICLVCKGKISGLNFMCSKCGTFYCLKCSEALSNLENVCWGCNNPIDKSKPSKPYEKEEDMVIETNIRKNGKEKQNAKAPKTVR